MNLKKTGLIVLILLTYTKVLLAQDPSLKLVNPLTISPQAASFIKYGEIPVSMSSGVPQISIPLANIESGEVKFPVTLSYHAGGIKVEEVAANVGLGWNLSFGGVISRQVRGLPDENGLGYSSTGYWTTNYFNHQLNSQQLQTYLTGLRTGGIDSERDIYYFTLPGGESGKFFIDDNGTYVSMPKSNMKIEKLCTGNAHCWKLTSDKGIQYYFDEAEYTTTENLERINGLPSGSSINFSGVSSCYLGKIIDRNGDTVKFEYDINKIIYTTKSVDTKKILIASPNNLACPSTENISSSLTNTTYTARVKSIKWMNGEISFIYNTQPRLDMENDEALSSIVVANSQGVNVKKYQFYTSYFYYPNFPPESSDPTLAYRLRLDSLKEFSSDDIALPPYRFEYNPLLMDNRLSNSQDYWGYYNGRQNTEFVSYFQRDIYGVLQKKGANKEVDTVAAQANVLKKIYYPTGGNTSFEYESNTYGKYQDSSFNYQTIVANVFGNNSGGPEWQTLFEFTQPFVIGINDVTTNGQAVVRVHSVQGGCESAPSFCNIEKKLFYPDGHFRMINHNDTLHLQPGNYILKGFLETDVPGDPYLYLDLSLSLGSIVPAGYVDRYSGGLRVKRIINNDGNGISGIKEYYYNTFNENYSSGSIGNNNLPSYNRQQTDHNYSPSAGGGVLMSRCLYELYSSASNYPLLTSNGTFTTYENVTVVEKNSVGTTNGKSEYSYTTFNSHPDISFDMMPFPPSCSYDWMRGMLLKEKHYSTNANGTFTLVEEKTNKYNYSISPAISPENTVKDLKFGLAEYHNGFAVGDSILNSSVVLQEYLTTTEVWYLKSDTITKRDVLTGQKLVNVNTYNYDEEPVLMKSQVTNDSRGNIIKTSYKYPTDYVNAGFITDMLNANYLNAPIETYVSSINSLGEEKITAANLFTYKSNKTVKDKVYGLNLPTSVPLTQFQVSSMDGTGGLISDSRYEELLEYKEYDQFGNILEQAKSDAPNEVFIWGYNHRYPVAKIIGVDYNAAVQFVDLNILNNTSTSDVQMRLELDNLRQNLPDAQVTTFTYKPLVGMTSSTDPKGMTTYYEYDGFQRLLNIKDHNGDIVKNYRYNYKQDAGSTVYYNDAVNRDFQKDDCPWGQEGSTVNYAIAAGAYSAATQEEANGLATADLSANGQNYANTHGTCSGGSTVYYNTALSQGFQKNDCPSGQTGSSVTYTVPASTYSASSQSAADAQAAADITANGQNYANSNGTCSSGTVYYNTVLSQGFQKNDCPSGQTGSSVTYTVAANTYSASTQAAADAQATADMTANGQAYANTNGTCSETVYYNVEASQHFARNDCPEGKIAYQVSYTVPAGTYSASSQAAADALAAADIAANGQAYANSHGQCLDPEPDQFFNAEMSRTFRKNDCGPGYAGSLVTYTVPANLYSSGSQQGADVLAANNIAALGQNYANTHGTCTAADPGVYYSVAMSQSFQRNNCGSGGTGTSATYTVPAGLYTGNSQSAADALAAADLAANGQNYANTVAWCNSTVYYNAALSQNFQKNDCPSGQTGTVVTFTIAANTYSGSTQAAADALAAADMSTYGQVYANGTGSCLAGTVYYNTEVSYAFQKDNCPSGQTGSSVTYTVPAGTYPAGSQYDADMLAVTDLANNGQAYANANGSCGIFLNTAFSQSFQKNDCGTGLAGTSVSYSVPAGRYAAGSQSAANALAAAEAAANGQSYANANGTCIAPSSVYARFEMDNLSYTDNMHLTPATFERTADMHIRLYSDAACTVPYTTSSALDVNIRTVADITDYLNPSGSGSQSFDISFTVPSGSSQVFLGNGQYYYYLDNPGYYFAEIDYTFQILAPSAGYSYTPVN